MKTTFRRTLSLVLALLLVFSMTICSFAAENDDPYLEVRSAIYSQLEAQNALHLYDHFCSILIPEVQDSSTSTRAANGPWYAPNGGVVQYTYDYTYRGEDGYVTSILYYFDMEDTVTFLNARYDQDGSDLLEILDIVSFPFSFMLQYVIYAQLLEDTASLVSVAAAGGYAKAATVYDSISDTNTSVVVGWDTYPTIPSPRSDAYNVVFRYG